MLKPLHTFQMFAADGNMDHVRELNDHLKMLTLIVQEYSPPTAASIQDFVKAVEFYLAHKSFPKLKEFVPFWGRATQYLSFTRRIG